MPRGREQDLEHLLRRAGFGATQQEVDNLVEIGYRRAVDQLVDHDQLVDDVDQYLQKPGYVGVTSRGPFSPNTVINDARQRWLFRMVHSQRPLEEKMTLFWHNHFATAFSKIAGAAGSIPAARMMAAKPSEDPAGVRGHLEVLRHHALGNFQDLLLEVTRDPAMLFWLDGRTNVRNRPQENYARELMELFTMGVGTFGEADVYAGARVFTGWNVQRQGSGETTYFRFAYNPGQHDTSAKEFSFPISPDGGRRIPARSAADGMQDGLDLLAAVTRHPETGRRLARKLWGYFVSETDAPDERWVGELTSTFEAGRFEIKPLLRRIFTSPEFRDAQHARYSWPVEFVVRGLKEVGWVGFSLGDALTPLTNMGQQLLEPPDVNGWDLGRGWFSSGTVLARMNFAAQLATNQKFRLRDASRPYGGTPESLLSFVLDRLTPAELDRDVRRALLEYLGSGSAWNGGDAQLLQKTAGLVHLLVGAGEYQLV